MTREEIINEIKCLLSELNSGKDAVSYLTQNDIKWLNENIKALEQEPRWIPVSERLPNDRREVLVTAYWHETYQVMMASYYGDGLWWCVPFNNCGEHTQKLNPKAWVPLPKAYSEVEE